MTGIQGVGVRLNRVCESSSSLYKVLQDFEVVIAKENEAIGRSDLAELESITEDKIIFGEKVKKQIRALKESMDELAVEVGDVSLESSDDRQLTKFVSIIGERILASYPDLESDFKVMQGWASKLKDYRIKIFARVETNAYLVKRLLQYHRETYAFWQAVARDSEAVYGETGKTKYGNGPQKSILNVRT